MDFTEQLRILQTAQGDPGQLALAMVDIAYHDLPETDRLSVRSALEAAAIPTWCDFTLLSILLGSTKREAQALLSRLRKLKGIVEPFAASDPEAIKVTPDVREALRKRWSNNDAVRLKLLSRLAHAYFSGVGVSDAEVEALLAQFTSAPELAARESADQIEQWEAAEQPRPQLALAEGLKNQEFEGKPLKPNLPRLFVSYSHENYASCHRSLMVRVRILENRQILSLWCDRMIKTGEEWDKKIKTKVEESEMFVFFITANFLESAYIRTKEASRALERHQSGQAQIIPVLLETCSWERELWGGLQPVPTQDGRPKPVREWNQPAKAWLQVERAIEDAAKATGRV